MKSQKKELIIIVKVRMDLQQAKKFIEVIKSGKPKLDALDAAKGHLLNVLWAKIYVNNLTDLYSVKDAAEMRRLMKTTGIPPRGDPYEANYLRYKIRTGHTNVHELSGLMKANTTIKIDKNVLKFEIPKSSTTRAKTTRAGKTHIFNFGPIHERRKSILKSTFVFAWEKIIKSIRKVYEDYAKSV